MNPAKSFIRTISKIFAHSVWVVLAAAAMADPQYQIYDLGVVQMDHSASYGYGISPGGMAVGCSLLGNTQEFTGSQAFTWTQGGSFIGLPNLAGRNFCLSKAANGGIVVGSCPTSESPNLGDELPVIWQHGTVSQLPLPTGYTIGAAHSVNASGIAVGSVGSGASQRGVIYTGKNAGIISQTTPGGSFFTVAYGINDSGRIAGGGSDNVGIVHDTATNTTFSIGAFQGAGNSIGYAVNKSGRVVGWSFPPPPGHLVGLPFVWSEATGMVAIPVVQGTEGGGGQALGVNSDGWVVGLISTIPFLYDGTTVYRLADLLPAGSGWNLETSQTSLGISDNGTIVGSGRHNNQTRTYAMVRVPSTPTPTGTPPPTPPPTTTHFVISASLPSGVGSSVSIAVSARDQFNHTAAGYTGTVHFTSTGGAFLPPNSTLTNGTGFFVVTLKTPGNQTITATDTSNGSITGTSNSVFVPPPETPFARVTATATSTATVPPATPTPTATVAASATPTPTPTSTPCLPVITQSSSQVITTPAPLCRNPSPMHNAFDNHYWRAFNMQSFAGGGEYVVSSVSFGVFQAIGTSTATVRLYANNGAPFPAATGTQIGTTTLTVTAEQAGTIVNTPLVATIPAGTIELVMELFEPIQQSGFPPGGNTAPETGPSYWNSPDFPGQCPASPSVISSHLIFNVYGSCPGPSPTPTPTPTPAPTPTPCLPVLTQSSSQAITAGNSASCNDGNTHTDNSYWRAFDMAAYAGGGQYCINSVSFGVEFANATQPVTVRLYKTSNFPTGFPGSLTQIGTTTLNVGSAQNGTVVTTPLVVTVPAGTAQLVMELFTPNGQPGGYRFFVGSNAALETGPSYWSAPDCGIPTPTTTDALDFPNMHIVFDVNGTCACPTPTPCPLFNVTGTVGQCTTTGPSGAPLPGVTITRTGSGGDASTVTDNSGNYFMSGFSCVANTLTPSKAARPPGSNGIDTTDVLAVQRHFLGLAPLTGCRLTAADCAAPVGISTGDVIAIQRYFLSRTTGIGNVGQYGFTPPSRSYSPPINNQTEQNYDAIVFGDVVAPFAVP